MSGAVKVSRFGFTEGSGWFELLALQQLCSEARDRSLSPPPTLLAEWGGSQRPPLATRALRNASDGRVEVWGGASLGPSAPLVQTPMVGSLLGPIPLADSRAGSPRLPSP